VDRLHVCKRCEGTLVRATDHSARAMGWWVRLECLDCGFVRQGVFGRADVERFDDEQDRQDQRLREDADTLHEAFDRDLIGPDDFKVRTA